MYPVGVLVGGMIEDIEGIQGVVGIYLATYPQDSTMFPEKSGTGKHHISMTYTKHLWFYWSCRMIGAFNTSIGKVIQARKIT